MHASKHQNVQEPSAEPHRDSPVLLVPECQSTQELAEFAGGLGSLLASAPREVTLRFLGVHHMTADAALVLHEVLRQKAPTTLLITEAWSSLINGSALLWLLGDRRRIRPTAWLFFRKAEPKRENEEIPFDFDAIFGGPPGIDLQSFAPIRPLSDFMNPISVATLASL